MTAGGPPKGSIAETVQTTDGFLRHAGRDFLVVLYTAVRSLKLYPIENAQVQKALDDLTTTTKHLLDVEKRSEEHTSELQSQSNLVCRLLLEKKKKKTTRVKIHEHM